MESETEQAGSLAPLALVLTGGGARGAYQVGVLRSIAKSYPDLRVPILTGVSAGGINVAFLATGVSGFRDAVERLTDLWLDLSPERVFDVGLGALAKGVAKWLFRLGSGGFSLAPQVRGLVDTQPLRDLIEEALVTNGGTDCELCGVDQNLADGSLEAVGVSAVDYATGRTIIFCQGRDIEDWRGPYRYGVDTRLTVDHVMASAALPLMFPAVEIEGRWYGDGGVRLTNPLSPAIHLGARRIIAVSTRNQPPDLDTRAREPVAYPPPGQVGGVLLNAVFLDSLDRDALNLQRINRLLKDQQPGQAAEGLKPIDLLLVRPSEDLGALAARYEPNLPKGLRFLTRGLTSKDGRGSDLVSLLMFQRDYIEALIDIGEADGEAQAEGMQRIVGPVV